LPRFESDLAVNFVLSPIIILFFAAFFFPVIRRSRLPPAFFGFCLDNWRAALPFAAVVSVAFLAILVLLKWILIIAVPRLHGLDLIGLADIRIAGHDDADTHWYWIALALYLFLTPVQELVGAAASRRRFTRSYREANSSARDCPLSYPISCSLPSTLTSAWFSRC